MKEITNNKGIIEGLISRGASSGADSPVVMCVVGRPGSGKSTFIREEIGEEFIRLDAGLIYTETGGENAADFPGSLSADLDDIGRAVATQALQNRFDLIVEFTGSDTTRMQMLMRALSDIGYEVEFKYMNVDLNQANIWNSTRMDESVAAQDTDEYHFRWLEDGVNASHGVPTDVGGTQSSSEGAGSARGLIASLFRRAPEQLKKIDSMDVAREMIGKYMSFEQDDKSLIRDVSNLPVHRDILMRAFDYIADHRPQSGESDEKVPQAEFSDIPDFSDAYRRLFDYQEIDAHDLELISELKEAPTERDIAIQLTREELKASQEEDLNLIRLHRGRLVNKYRHRAEAEFAERPAPGSNAGESTPVS